MVLLSTRILEITKKLREGVRLLRGSFASWKAGCRRAVASYRAKKTPARDVRVRAAVEQVRSGETIVSSGVAAANRLGWTTQVVVREVYLRYGLSREPYIGKQMVELKHASGLQLVLANGGAGAGVRGACRGRAKARQALRSVSQKLTPAESLGHSVLQDDASQMALSANFDSDLAAFRASDAGPVGRLPSSP
ncbi:MULTISPECIES: DUF6088 family protein [unclassified Bradyrhizobium]